MTVFGVAVKLTVVDVPVQMDGVTDKLAVGNGRTITSIVSSITGHAMVVTLLLRIIGIVPVVYPTGNV